MIIKNEPTVMQTNCNEQTKCITNDLVNINNTLCNIEDVVETILIKINGDKEGNAVSPEKPSCISEMLEDINSKTERLFYKLNQINNMI